MTITTVKLQSETRDKLFKLKFRKSYDTFLKELCELYEKNNGGKTD